MPELWKLGDIRHMKAKLYIWIFGSAYILCAVMFFVIIAGFQPVLSGFAVPLPYFTKVVFAIGPVGWLLLTVAVGASAIYADLRFRSRSLGFVFVIVLALMGCCIAIGVILPIISMHQMTGNAPPNKSLQPTATAPSVLTGT